MTIRRNFTYVSSKISYRIVTKKRSDIHWSINEINYLVYIRTNYNSYWQDALRDKMTLIS